MDKETVLRVGIVGCGYQGGILAQAVSKSQSFKVVACADPDREAANKLATDSGSAAIFESVERLLAGSDVDVVFVATPHHLLAPTSLAAIRAGKHVLGEKPIGLTEAEAIQIEKAVARAQVCFEAGYSFRYLPAWQRVHELLTAGAVGEIVAMTGVFSLPAMSKGWKATPETGGGPLLFIGVHLIDQMLWYAKADAVEVFAHVSRRADTNADETSAFQIRFANGVEAQCIVSQTSPALVYKLDIFGRAGRISLNTVGGLDHEIVVQSAALSEFAQPTTIRPSLDGDIRMVKHGAQLAAFAATIREKREPPITVGDGRKVLKVFDAILRSGETGKPVQLTLADRLDDS